MSSLFSLAPFYISAPLLSNLSPTMIRIAWTPPAFANGMLTGYNIFRSITSLNGSQTLIAFVSAPTLMYSDSNVAPYTEYGYRIEAINDAGSVASPLASITSEEAGKWLETDFQNDKLVESRDRVGRWMDESFVFTLLPRIFL